VISSTLISFFASNVGYLGLKASPTLEPSLPSRSVVEVSLGVLWRNDFGLVRNPDGLLSESLLSEAVTGFNNYCWASPFWFAFLKKHRLDSWGLTGVLPSAFAWS
jgi:hypothetical protein